LEAGNAGTIARRGGWIRRDVIARRLCPMTRMTRLALCLLALATLAGCIDYYNELTMPEARFDPGDQ
jgi:hypothetical protein